MARICIQKGADLISKAEYSRAHQGNVESLNGYTLQYFQEGMELQGQGRGLCISFSWLVNDKTLIGKASVSHMHPGSASWFTHLSAFMRQVQHENLPRRLQISSQGT